MAVPTRPGPLSQRLLRRSTPPHTPPRGQGTPRWSPPRTCALPSLRRRPFPSRPAKPLPRGPTSVQSLPPAQVRSRDGIRCQPRCQTPPVGGGEASPDLLLSASHHPRPSWAQERGAPGRRLKGALPALAGERRSGSHLNSAGSGREGRQGWGSEPQLTGLHCSPGRDRGQAEAEAEAEQEGAREGPPRAHGSAREPPPPPPAPLSEPPSLPPRLPATDGAAGGMTGNSWARAAESKYEQRRRAREDRGARPPRTGPAARASAAASSLPSLNPPPPGLPPRGRQPPSATGGALLPEGMPLQYWGPRAERSIPPPRVPPKTPKLKERRTITRRPDS